MNWREHITVDPGICHGKPCVSGTRVPVSIILDNLAEGIPTSEILSAYPTITEDSVRAAIAYAAELARERQIAMPA